MNIQKSWGPGKDCHMMESSQLLLGQDEVHWFVFVWRGFFCFVLFWLFGFFSLQTWRIWRSVDWRMCAEMSRKFHPNFLVGEAGQDSTTGSLISWGQVSVLSPQVNPICPEGSQTIPWGSGMSRCAEGCPDVHHRFPKRELCHSQPLGARLGNVILLKSLFLWLEQLCALLCGLWNVIPCPPGFDPGSQISHCSSGALWVIGGRMSLLLPIFLQGYNEALTLQGCLTTERGCQRAWCQQKDVFPCHKIIQVSWKPCTWLFAVVFDFPSEPCQSLVLVCALTLISQKTAWNFKCLFFWFFFLKMFIDRNYYI